MNKELFVETIEKLRDQYDYDSACAETLAKVYKEAYSANLLYDNHRLTNQIIKILQIQMKDENKNSWIEFFMWELDFGRKNAGSSAWRKDGSVIDLSDAGKLYDYLTDGGDWITGKNLNN